MDPFGHAASGVALAQVLRPPDGRGGRYWPALGALAALAPDVDAVTWLLGGPALFRAHHQIYTHNLFVFATVPPLFGLLAARRAPPGTARGRVVALVWGAWALHLLGDTIAYWPERLLWPFSDEGLAFGLVAQDFSIGLAALLMVGAAASFVDTLAPWRRVVGGVTLLAGGAYVLVGPGL